MKLIFKQLKSSSNLSWIIVNKKVLNQYLMQIKTLNQYLFQTVLVWHSMSSFVLHKAFAEVESRE